MNTTTELIKIFEDITSKLLESTEPNTLYNAVVQIAMQNTDAQACSLYLEATNELASKEPHVIIMVAGAGYEKYRIGAKYTKGQGLTGSIWEQSESVKFDTQKDLENLKGSWKGLHNDTLKEKVPNWKCFSLIGVPLRIGEKTIGVLKVENKNPGSPEHFSLQDQATLEIIASTIAMAIENQRLTEQTYSAILYALRDVSEMLVGKQTMSIPNFCDRVVYKCIEVFNSQACSIYLEPYEKNREDEYIEMISGSGYEKHRKGAKYNKGEGLTGSIWLNSESVKYDTQEDVENTKGSWKGKYNEDITKNDPNRICSSLIGVPLRIGDHTIGVLKVENKKPSPQSHFNHNELRSLEILASNIALSIEMQRNYESKFMEGERARDFTHSLRNKINTAIVNIRDAKSSIKKADKQNDLYIVNECLDIVDSTLSEISEYQKGALSDTEGNKSNISILELIKDLSNKFNQLFNEKDVEFIINQPKEDRILYINKQQILEGLGNIIGNAIDALTTIESPKLWLEVNIASKHGSEQVIIKITDNGIGLTEAQKKEFANNKIITSTKRFALGSGIARANRCFADNAAHFEFIDPPVEKTSNGASFIITFSAYMPQDLRILIIDDEQATLDTFKRKVKEKNNLIGEFRNNLEILQNELDKELKDQKAYIRSFDYILLDCHFNNSAVDGIDIYKRFIEFDLEIAKKIILMSGQNSFLIRKDVKIKDKYTDILNDFSIFISNLSH